MDLKQIILQEVEQNLSPARREHTYASERICTGLARRFALDPEAAWVAAMWHDTAREWKAEELVSYVESRQLERTALEKKVPMLLHSLAAAHRLKEECSYERDDVWLAVRWHTTGHPSMGKLGYALYVADFLEPHREHITDGERETILSKESLEQMMLEIYRRQFSFFSKNDISPEPASLHLYHLLKAKVQG